MVMEVVRSTKVILAHFKIQCPLSFMTSLEEVKNSHHDNLKLQQRCIEFMSTVETLQLYPAPSDDTEASKSASVSALIHPIGVDVSSKGETQQEIEMESVSLPPPPPAHSPPPQPVFSESDQRLVKSLFAGVSSSNAIPTRSRSPNSSSYGSASPTPSLLVDIDDGQAISEMKLF